MYEEVLGTRLTQMMRNSAPWKVARKILRKDGTQKDEIWTGGSLAENYQIRLGYKSRRNPSYFIDESSVGITSQPMVYPFAAERAIRSGCDTIIDIGCGRAKKLARLHGEHPDWNFIGVDFGKNIKWCRANYSFGKWINFDLEGSVPAIDDRDLRNAVIICSDVIEHLIDPDPLLDGIGSLLERGACEAVLSTPERDLARGPDDPGPPLNPCHVREWTGAEFRALLESRGFAIDHLGLTRTTDADPSEKTILAAVRKGAR